MVPGIGAARQEIPGRDEQTTARGLRFPGTRHLPGRRHVAEDCEAGDRQCQRRAVVARTA